MFKSVHHKSAMRAAAVAAGALVALAIGIPAVAVAAPHPASVHQSTSPKPTIVLVHGAWADASSFALVSAQLQRDGYVVRNAPNPLRGLASDAAYLAAYVNQSVTGPVILVGHSYGGAVITDAAANIPTARGLVYVDAYAPDQGESVIQLTGAQPGSALGVADPSTVLDFVQYPGAPTGDVDAYIKPSLFPSFFAAHLPSAVSNELAYSQSPVTLSALTAPSTAPAWKTLPSYFFIGNQDKILPPAEQQIMAKRAGGHVVQADADHLSMLEVPSTITGLIERAAG